MSKLSRAASAAAKEARIAEKAAAELLAAQAVIDAQSPEALAKKAAEAETRRLDRERRRKRVKTAGPLMETRGGHGVSGSSF